MKLKDSFDGVIYALPEDIGEVLRHLPKTVKNSVYEIRLRVGKPVCLTADRVFYVSRDAVASSYPPSNPLICSPADLREVAMRISCRSLYTREQEINQGYLSMRNGCRAGICGSFSGGNLNEISSVNIRIARQIKGCADPLLEAAAGGLLIAGPPASGKTTLLRDLVRQLSDLGKKVCVIDARGEICPDGMDVGINTDIIRGKTKAEGIEIGVRTMFPDFIAFDEIGNGDELKGIRESFFSGVTILTTAHISGEEELVRRGVTRELLDCGIGTVALLDGRVGSDIRLIAAKEVSACLRV